MNRFVRAAAVGALLLVPAVASAQTPGRMQWGPQVSLLFEGSDVGVGARMHHSLSGVLGGAPISGILEGNWFPGTPDIFDFNYQIVYNFRATSITPYAGGGLNLLMASPGSSDFHLNALGGLIFRPMGLVTPVLQLRYVFVGGGDAFIGTFGVLF